MCVWEQNRGNKHLFVERFKRAVSLADDPGMALRHVHDVFLEATSLVIAKLNGAEQHFASEARGVCSVSTTCLLPVEVALVSVPCMATANFAAFACFAASVVSAIQRKESGTKR